MPEPKVLGQAIREKCVVNLSAQPLSETTRAHLLSRQIAYGQDSAPRRECDRLQQPVCHGEPVVVEVVDKSGPDVLFKEFHEMRLAVAGKFCHIFNGNVLGIVVFNIF